MNAKGKGKYNVRDIKRIMKNNGYTLINERKHMVFRDTTGDIVSLPKNCKDSVLRYEFKHHNIKEDL